MGLDITVSRCDVAKCPYCGKPIRGTIRDYEDSGGRSWGEYLEKIGYYAPYEIREKEPERDFYGKRPCNFCKRTRPIQLGKHCGACRSCHRKRRFCSYKRRLVRRETMDAVEFFKTANRLCKNQSCRKCPACKNGVCMVMNMVRLDGKLVESIEETVSKV